MTTGQWITVGVIGWLALMVSVYLFFRGAYRGDSDE